MPEGSEDAWFVRRGSGLFTNISPTGPMGWLISAIYALGIVGLALLVEWYPRFWLIWAALIVSATLLYTITVWRLSVPVAGHDSKGKIR